MDQAHEVKMASDNKTHNNLGKKYGIKGVPILSCISSITFPSSFPFNFMPFQGLKHEGKDYFIGPHIWEEIGATTAASCATIPSVFGALVPDIAKKQFEMSAEMYANWTFFIAPIVLHGRFKKP